MRKCMKKKYSERCPTDRTKLRKSWAKDAKMYMFYCKKCNRFVIPADH